jgi:hypothetical protein
MDDPELTPSQWIARCAARLGARWRTAATADLEAAAVEVWRDPSLRELAPEDAAAAWLAPVCGACGTETQNRPPS